MTTAVQLTRRTAVAGAACALAAGCASANEPPKSFRERIAARRAGRSGGSAASSTAVSTERLQHSRALPGTFSLETRLGEWVDQARGNRSVLWKAYLPAGASKVPVVIYSHGGGGTRETGKQFGEHLATHGIGSLHLQHVGSDRDAFRSDARQIAQAVTDPKLGKPRFEDVAFAVAELKRGQGPSSLDSARIGVAGHSFGAITALIVAGQTVTGFGQSLAVPSIMGAFALSPSPPRSGYGDEATAFAKMLAPVFHLTGTQDDAPNGDFKAPARRIPFDRTTTVDQRLIILNGANHFTFGGDANPQLRGQSFGYPGLERHHDLIRAAAVAFWQSIFNNDAAARAFLDGGEFNALLGVGDTLEIKPASR
jgi:predicted dienelactone hydrolase